jgi:hypothetical protein
MSLLSFYEDHVVHSYTFSTRWHNMEMWLQSSGRWKEMSKAAEAAAEWLQVCAENGMICEVRVESVQELNLMPHDR